MDRKTVFIKTDKGENEAKGLTDALFGDSKRIFNLVDDESTVAEISKRAPPSLRNSLESMLQELVTGGFIQDINAPAESDNAKSSIKIASPAFKMAKPKTALPEPASVPSQSPVSRSSQSSGMPEMRMPDVSVTPSASQQPKDSPSYSQKGDLDFSFIMSGNNPVQDAPDRNLEVAQAKAAEEAAAEAARRAAAMKAAASEEAKRKAYEAAKIKAQIEVAARAKIEAEARAKREAESARLKADQAALKVRMESDAARARIEAEVKIRLEAEAKIKREADAIRIKAEQEAERLRKELEEAKIRAEIELRNRLEAEAKARAEHEARLKREAEAERLRLEKERAELEAARIKAEAELKMREEAEARVRAALDARLKAEAAAKLAEEQKLYSDMSSLIAPDPVRGKKEGNPVDKLRESFAKTAGKDFKSQPYTTGSFKLEAFSLVDTGQMPALNEDSAKPPAAPGGGSKVKAAVEARERKKAEEEKQKSEQEALRQQQKQAGEAEARAKAEAEAAKAQAEAVAQKLKAEQEAYRQKQREEEEAARAATAAEELSSQQAKQWEDAQLRAQQLVQAEQDRLAKENAELKKQAKMKSRSPRKPLPTGKIVAALLIAIVIGIVALPAFWPMDEYISPLEAELSAQLKQPVHLKKIEASLVPLPKLTLKSVNVGGENGVIIGEVDLVFGISALFAPTKSVNELNFRDVNIPGAMLQKTAAWIQVAGGLEKYPVSRMNFKSVSLLVPSMKLPVLKGRAVFNELGKFVTAQLSSDDEKLALELKPEQNGVHMSVNLHDSSLPVFSHLKFNDLSVNASMVNREIVLSDFFAHIYGGTLTGKGKLDWSSGWKLNGQINSRNLDIDKMFPDYVIKGELAGEMNLTLVATNPGDLDHNPQIEGSFEARNGEIKKIDIESIARVGVRPGVSGHTNYSELTGTIKANREQQRIILAKLASTTAITTGIIDVDSNKQMSGRLQVDIKNALGSASVPMKLSGTLTDPELQPVK